MVRGLANMGQQGEKRMNKEYLLLHPCQLVPLMSEKSQEKLQTPNSKLQKSQVKLQTLSERYSFLLRSESSQ